MTNTETSRIHWLDNLRTVTIFLVVLYHIGGVYEAAGLWGRFWIVDDPTTMTWVGIMGIVFDVMVMPLMFFIAGYLTPSSLQNRTTGTFIKDKLKRLMLPWLLAVLVLIPGYKIVFLYSRNLPQEHWTTYSWLTNPNSQNWLWFLPVLFLFNMLYLLGTRIKFKMPDLSPWVLVSIVSVIGLIISFFTGSLMGFRTWTLTPVLDFENERIIMYFMCFLMGAWFFKKEIFSQKPEGKIFYIIISTVAWIPIMVHIFARIWPFFYPDGYDYSSGYRFIWWSSFYLTLITMMYLMVESFRRYVTGTDKVWAFLNRNSYGVYIIHVIIIGIFGTLFMQSGLHVGIKYPLMIVFVYAVSNLATEVYRTGFRLVKRP